MKLLLDYVAEQGKDPAELVRPFGLPLHYFDVAEARVPVAVTDRMWEDAARLCEDPNLGLHVTARFGPGNNGIVSYLVAHSGTLGAAVQRLVEYFPVISSHTRYRLERGCGRVRLYSDLNRPCPGRQPEEVMIAAVANFGKGRCGPTFRVERASFRSPPPPTFDDHLDLFGHDITFNARETWLELGDETLRLRVASADEQLAGLLELAARRSPSDEGALLRRVRLYITELVTAGQLPRCEQVASRLAMSPRTLRRKLSELGSNYRELVDDVLSGMAAPLLRDASVPLQEVVVRLQFSDIRALANATRRWFGMTPQQYRKVNTDRTRI